MTARYGEVRSFEEVFPVPETVVAGTKAVFRVMTSRFLCFAKGHARPVAEFASTKPWVITVGSRDAESPALRGRLLNVARLSQTYGPTSLFTRDPVEAALYSRWPESVAVHDVYDFIDLPHVNDDLHLSFHPNEGAYGRVAALNGTRSAIFDALRGQYLQLSDIPALPHFRDPGSLRAVRSMLPKQITAKEGLRITREIQVLERNSSVSNAAKENNRLKNGGVYVCEGCDFRHADKALFDAHHTKPLSHGQRETTPSCLAVLCPTCHRAVHKWSAGRYLPMAIAELRERWMSLRMATMSEAT